ncbi:MAG: OsmC family protein [Gemmatimonadetes bacterium]|nr:OsmC family protein [Gemmatimonadota bacterium]
MSEAPAEGFGVTLTLERGYRFAVDAQLPGVAPFVIDEGPPLGDGEGPNPSRVLASAMASCLGSSLLFCLGKSRVAVRGLRVEARGTMARNERGRLRVGHIAISLHPDVAPEDVPRMARCLELFEDFCVVTESVRHGIPVDVTVGAVR